jgi:hypothetical protein
MPPSDLLVEVQAEATVQDLIDAIVRYKDLTYNPYYGLIRTMVRIRDLALDKGIRYLPEDLPLADCGLLDGATLHLADRSLRPASTLYIDREQADDDLYLIDERGTHRGRVTRLPIDIPVLVGIDPPDDGGRSVLVDDSMVAAHALTLINRGGNDVQCTALQKEGLYLSGTPATEVQTRLLPGNSISFRRNGTDYVSFLVTTRGALHGRSPVGRVQFDVTARLEDPAYDLLPDRNARIRAQPKIPEHRPFPWEQVLIPLGIVAALYLATKSTL